MTDNLREKLKESWAGKKLTEAQFEEYLFLYEQFPQEFAIRDSIINEINQKLVGDPEGEDGERIACFMRDLAEKMKNFFSQHLKLGVSMLKSIQSGQLTQLELTPEGCTWMSRAILAHWLKRWNNLYDKIVENLAADPHGKMGKSLANEWRVIIDDYFAAGSKDFMTGLVLWQETARQDQEIKELKTPLSPKEMLQKVHIKLLVNPEAASWISQALEMNPR